MTKEETIITTSATIAKTSGVLTAGGASTSILTQYFNEITLFFGFIGATCTVVSLCVMLHYSIKRDRREKELHQAKMDGYRH